ncbi:MAG: thiamine pyrophosphate-binding protein, partial [Deltaproteobacteria bacterium]|nr:thiamine pyrophosphate-binding protein [Deltaproteobacteria bacterium]
MVQARDMICDVLVESGIDHVFGIPGGGTIGIYDALYDHRDQIRTILTRHEHGASCMADMYGRLMGRPAVLMGQGAFIGSSGAFGIMEAHASSSPMLVLTDTSDYMFPQQGRYQGGTGEYGSFDLLGILRSISKYVALASTPKEAVQGVQLAVKHATSGRPGPACVLMRSAAIVGDIDNSSPPHIHRTPGYLSNVAPIAREEDVKQVIDRLTSAKRPVIIAGNGVRMAGAYNELMTLAEDFSAAVATSYKGKSCFPEDHPLAAGMMGRYGQAVTNQIVGQSDFLLVVGCRLSPTDTCQEDPGVIDPARQKIIQIDIDPRNAGWTFPVERGLIGDAKAILGQIIRMAGQMGASGDRERLDRLVEQKKKGNYFEDPRMHAEDSPILPQRLVRILQDTLDPSTIMTLDAGDNRVWVSHYFMTRMPGTLFAPGGIAGMGWGAPAA